MTPGGLRHPFGCDQLVEPFHFALTGFQAQLMQLLGVAIEGTAGPGDGFPQALATFLDLAPPAFQDPHSGFGRGAVEEGQMYPPETVVGVVLWPGVGDQLGEALRARFGELVDASRPTDLEGAFGCRVLDDQPSACMRRSAG